VRAGEKNRHGENGLFLLREKWLADFHPGAVALLSQGLVSQSPTNRLSPAYEWFRSHRLDTTLKASIEVSMSQPSFAGRR
jgi:hypothetical protein